MGGMSPGLADFPLGTTFYGASQTPPASPYDWTVQLEGTVRIFQNRDPSNRTLLRHAGHIEAWCVRNTSTAVLLASRGCKWQAGFIGMRCDGHTIVPSEEVAGVVDEYLPGASASGSVPVGDLFWLLRRGKITVYSPHAGALGGDITLRGPLVASTGSASTNSTDSGRFRLSATSLTTSTNIGSVIEDNIRNSIGRALTARTTSNTLSAILVDLNITQ